MGVEIAFALYGWPGLGRYMFGAAALTAVIGAILLARLLTEPASLVARHTRSPRLQQVASSVGGGLAVALVAALIPATISRTRQELHDLHLQRLRSAEIDRLALLVSRLGGPARVRGCGEPLTSLEYQTVLAWTLDLNVAAVGFKYAKALREHNPAVFFSPIPTGGWRVHAIRQHSRICPASGR